MSSFCAPRFDQLHLCRGHSRIYNFQQVNPLDPEAFMSTTGVMLGMFWLMFDVILWHLIEEAEKYFKTTKCTFTFLQETNSVL